MCKAGRRRGGNASCPSQQCEAVIGVIGSEATTYLVTSLVDVDCGFSFAELKGGGEASNTRSNDGNLDRRVKGPKIVTSGVEPF
jgi:hypothetical protein